MWMISSNFQDPDFSLTGFSHSGHFECEPIERRYVTLPLIHYATLPFRSTKWHRKNKKVVILRDHLIHLPTFTDSNKGLHSGFIPVPRLDIYCRKQNLFFFPMPCSLHSHLVSVIVATHTSHVSQRSTDSNINCPLSSIGRSSSPGWKIERMKFSFRMTFLIPMKLGHTIFRKLWLIAVSWVYICLHVNGRDKIWEKKQNWIKWKSIDYRLPHYIHLLLPYRHY